MVCGLGEDQRTSTIKTHVSDFINYSTLNSEYNGKDICIQGINKYALPITITKTCVILYFIWFLLMFHHSFANATQIRRCKSDQ